MFSHHLNLELDDVYDAIRKNDTAGGLLAARNIMLKNNCMETLLRQDKNEYTSNSYRNEGNAAYAGGHHQQALILYNNALLFAPKYSRAMKLAYSNRSALLFKARYFSACLKDVNTCISMGCPSEVVDKLRKRKEEAFKYALGEELSKDARWSTFADTLMKPKSLNPDIPGASLDIKLIIESDGPKIVAARDINVGTVLALEAPFVSSTHPDNNFYSCFYCHKMSLNLIPCDGCCHALFCDESCQQKCMQDHHNVLCPIIDVFHTKMPDCILAANAVVKLRQTMSWKELIAISSEIDGNGLINEDNGILNIISKENVHFAVGRFFDSSLMNAIIMHYLDTKTDFFPQSDNRADAIIAASRIMMNLTIYATSIMLSPAVTINTGLNGKMQAGNHIIYNYGLFSFIGKLKKSCLSNVKPLAINRDVALVSLMSIKKDTEITVTHMSTFWLEEDLAKYKRPRKMFFTEKIICTCEICSGNWNTQTLNTTQAKIYKGLDMSALQRDCSPDNIFYMYKKICDTMQALSDAPYSKEFAAVYMFFLKCILYFLSTISCNFVICDI